MIHYEVGDARDPGARVAVFIHGFMGSGRDFRGLCEELSARRRCVRVDLPGHGRSAQTVGGASASIAFMAGEVLGVLDHLEVEAADVVGYSMGGRVGMWLAMHHPERVRTLVLESASPGIEGEEERAERARLDAARAREMREVGLERFLERWYGLELFDSLRAHPGFEAMVKERARGDVHALARVIAEASPGLQESLWPRLCELSMPTLWMAGRLDARYAAMAQRAARLSGEAFHIVEGAGHNAHLEAPSAVAEAIAAFWEGV
ncbi:2-succinyl-6-hydroxy-2,4-cyclohexadiene-1-carboxylate synthase [Lujinxingia vulgaris]|uniref:Putative 2-succinyl-6-hydroxy-2,4-cyclohexadiene-1-carboxylate synthase n=1 Tax=Lujinxingia vulgaris TaxID=2600176 RepID=A0A5C6XJF9_9DELT|nr:2-succinyl-6-hydroxy-2,4-cyclohexadiene-1-carboxylate synthase [Lujinxingia vulgaris]TXD37739.1 2-succinyl-6-hydroxy-2,4-cyclohexadiene-1-carboxylate synthase [Lujinxingia vulgaris]